MLVCSVFANRKRRKNLVAHLKRYRFIEAEVLVSWSLLCKTHEVNSWTVQDIRTAKRKKDTNELEQVAATHGLEVEGCAWAR